MSKDFSFPNIKPVNGKPFFSTHYNPITNMIFLGYREQGNDEQFIEAALNHEIMHWILLNFIGKRACKYLDKCLYGLHPGEFNFIAKW